MKKFRIRNGVAAIIIISMVIVAGCGKGTSSSTDDVKPDKDTTAVEENDTKEDDANDQQDSEDVKADSAEQEQQGDVADGDDAAGSSELNEYGVPEDLMQDLYDCVKESVLTGYIEPEGIAPEEFEWPGDDKETHVYAWNYLVAMYMSYLHSGSMYDTTTYFGFEKPEDSICKLMNSIFDGMVEWDGKVQKKVYKLAVTHSPIYKLFPENINFTD